MGWADRCMGWWVGHAGMHSLPPSRPPSLPPPPPTHPQTPAQVHAKDGCHHGAQRCCKRGDGQQQLKAVHLCVCVCVGGGGLRATGARVCHRGVPRPGARRGGGRRARALAHTRAHARTHTHAPQSVGLRGRRLCSPPGRAPPPADAMPQTAPLQRAASSTLAGPQPLPARAPPPPALGAGVGGWANE